MFELSFIWAGLIAFAVLAYVVLDGFDMASVSCSCSSKRRTSATR